MAITSHRRQFSTIKTNEPSALKYLPRSQRFSATCNPDGNERPLVSSELKGNH